MLFNKYISNYYSVVHFRCPFSSVFSCFSPDLWIFHTSCQVPSIFRAFWLFPQNFLDFHRILGGFLKGGIGVYFGLIGPKQTWRGHWDRNHPTLKRRSHGQVLMIQWIKLWNISNIMPFYLQVSVRACGKLMSMFIILYLLSFKMFIISH